MPVVAGVDSCPHGWIAVLVTFFDEIVSEGHYLLDRFEDLFNLENPPCFSAVDIPLGLLDEPEVGGRECDRAARKVLGHPRASSVFSPPTRSSFACSDYGQARDFSLNKQSFGILPKVREMDGIITPGLQARIREAHPEISFFVMAGLASAGSGKKKREGREERIDLLEKHFFQVREAK